MTLTDREERTAFACLVLSGLWVIMRMVAALVPPGHRHAARGWRADAIGHMDLVGQQTREAEAYRRERTFPDWRD